MSEPKSTASQSSIKQLLTELILIPIILTAITTLFSIGIWSISLLNKTHNPTEAGCYYDFPQERCHTATKKLLADPFYWDAGNDYAPHGSDNGADTLSSFIKWRQLHATQPSQLFIEQHLSNWGIYDTLTPTAQEIERDVIIAVAFAQMKIEGKCPKRLKDKALAIVRKEKEQITKDPAEYAEAIGYYNKLENALSKTPTDETSHGFICHPALGKLQDRFK